MTKLLSRNQFIEYFTDDGYDAGPASYIWLPETEIRPGPVANYFALVNTKIWTNYEEKMEYWNWCDNHLEFPVRCYYSGDDEAWGFVSQNDAVIWLLKFG
jgi:hypothetical protein